MTASAAARGYGAEHRRLRRIVLERDRYRCHWCGGRATQADHVIAKALGGPTVLDNLVAACGPCNVERGQQTAARLRQRRTLNPSRRWLTS